MKNIFQKIIVKVQQIQSNPVLWHTWVKMHNPRALDCLQQCALRLITFTSLCYG